MCGSVTRYGPRISLPAQGVRAKASICRFSLPTQSKYIVCRYRGVTRGIEGRPSCENASSDARLSMTVAGNANRRAGRATFKSERPPVCPDMLMTVSVCRTTCDFIVVDTGTIVHGDAGATTR